MIFEFIELNAGSDKPVLFDKDIELFTSINSKKFNLNQSNTKDKKVNVTELKDMINQQKVCAVVLNP